MKINIYLSLILIELFVGCKEKQPEYNLCDDFTKSIAAFNKGSYWIYQNDSTLITDSIYVNYLVSKLDYVKRSDLSEVYIENLICHLKSTLDSNLKIEIQVRGVLGSYLFSPWFSHFTIQNNIIYSGYSPQQLITTGLLDQQYQTYQLNGVNYTNVFEIAERISLKDSIPYTTDVYICPNFGLIKWNFQYKDSVQEKWSLLRSHINM